MSVYFLLNWSDSERGGLRLPVGTKIYKFSLGLRCLSLMCVVWSTDSSFIPWRAWSGGSEGGRKTVAQALETRAAWVFLHSLSLPSWEMGKQPLLHQLVRI